jgi:hypothetical protein
MLCVLVAVKIVSWIMVISDIQQTGDKLQIWYDMIYLTAIG